MVELADSIPELADYTTDSVIVGRLPLSNMFDILNPLKSSDRSRPRANWPSGYGPLLLDILQRVFNYQLL